MITALPFSDHTPPGMAEVVVQTQSIGEAIQRVIGALDERHIRRTGTAMTPEQLRLSLERLRRQDCRTYQNDPASAVFHSSFAPERSLCPR